MIHAINLVGRVFGRLTVLRRHEKNLSRHAVWVVECECGNQDIAPSYNLLRGSKKSCGCLSLEKLAERSTKHGMHGSAEYQCWSSMIARCTNTKATSYADYGARGIKVCDRWREFENFVADMGPRPQGMSIERINVNGDYEPGNCVWATDETQANNRRGLQKYLVDGEWLTVSQLVRRWGVTRQQAKVRASEYERMTVGVQAEADNRTSSDKQ